jgi:hypothetical protein
MAVMLPLHLQVTESGGATLAFPEFFGGDNDLFSRDPGADKSNNADIQYLELKIKLTTNPFRGAVMRIESGETTESRYIKIENTSSENEIGIIFNETDMKNINNPDNIPFTPKISYHFGLGAELLVPRVFETRELYFKAKVIYNISLKGNGE